MMLQGFKKVSNMGGGYLAWMENGFPIKMEEPAKVEELCNCNSDN